MLTCDYELLEIIASVIYLPLILSAPCLLVLQWEEIRDGFTINLIKLNFQGPPQARVPSKAVGADPSNALWLYAFAKFAKTL